MERASRPQVGLIHLEVIDRFNFAEFETAVRSEGLDLRIESRPDPGPYAGIEWLIPTAVVIYIGKAYFDSFLKEAGKDHYTVLKAAVSSLSSKFFGKNTPKGRVVFSEGKAESEHPRYSIFYSIVADFGDGYSVKLLLQSDFDADLCNEAQDAFLQFLSEAAAGKLDPNAVKGLSTAKPIGHTLLIAYNPDRRALEVIDPLGPR
ncbi:hypothetical protein [Lysobacter sp. Root916]|uniref:hypothetical protein n=1 Tax=Lysobacter sp. Root916 TaxID=1736606 RepID=UPI0012F7AA9B|nr:hypothetical protein [Lysobacter sp. Root916]